MNQNTDQNQDDLHWLDPKPPMAFRYFQENNGPVFAWTMEPINDGKYQSFVYRPVGPGSRTGSAKKWKLSPSSTRSHRRRKDAKARAERLLYRSLWG